MGFSLLPKEVNFFELFDKLAAVAVEASKQELLHRHSHTFTDTTIIPQPPRLDRANHQSERVYVTARQPAPRLALSRREPPRPLELLPLYCAHAHS